MLLLEDQPLLCFLYLTPWFIYLTVFVFISQGGAVYSGGLVW